MSLSAPQRSLWGRRLLIVTGLLMGVLLLGWFVLNIVWGGHRLGPQRNFTQELNSTIDSIPLSQRAWPELRRAVDRLDLDRSRSFSAEVKQLVKSSDALTQDRWLSANQEALQALRSALRLPKLGLPWDASIPEAPDQFLLLSPNERAALALADPNSVIPSEEVDLLIGLPLRFLQPMRSMARLLEADARSAVRTGDLSRAVDDCIAMLDVARLCQQDPMLISQLTGLSIRSLAQATILELVSTDSLGSDPDSLQRLARALSVPVARVSFAGERMIVEDTIQRFYSDDGSGDGVFLVSRLPEAYLLTSTPMPRLIMTNGVRLHELFLQPFVARAAGTRKQVIETFDGLVSEARKLRDTEPWAIDWTVLETRQGALVSDGILRGVHLFPLPLVTPGFDPLIIASHGSRFMHDCARLVVALHQFRVRHGEWPPQLDELQPDLLIDLPRDPYDGAPLRYEVRDNQPVIWSVGIDGVDQGGVFGANPMPFILKRAPAEPASPPVAALDERLWPMPSPAVP